MVDAVNDRRIPGSDSLDHREVNQKTHYQLMLTIHATIEKNGWETTAMIRDRSNTVVGRGQTRGDAINSAIKRWLASINPDSLVRNGAIRFQTYETDLIITEAMAVKMLRLSLGSKDIDVPAFLCEHFNFMKLDKKCAIETHTLLVEAIERLGATSVAGDFCVTLLDWAKESAGETWAVK